MEHSQRSHTQLSNRQLEEKLAAEPKAAAEKKAAKEKEAAMIKAENKAAAVKRGRQMSRRLQSLKYSHVVLTLILCKTLLLV